MVDDTAGEPMVVDETASSLVCPSLAKVNISSFSHFPRFQDTDGLLHPLVILNISDHFTRSKVQHPNKRGQSVFKKSMESILAGFWSTSWTT